MSENHQEEEQETLDKDVETYIQDNENDENDENDENNE